MMISEELRTHIPFLEPELLAEIEASALEKSFPTDTVLVPEGSFIQVIPIVLEGLIKVHIPGEEKDLLLYYIYPGESCIMSIFACVNQRQSEIVATTEEDTRLILLPADKLEGWLNRFPGFSRFVLNLNNRRYRDLLSTIDHLLFWNLEERLTEYLQKKAIHTGSRNLALTHQEIARDLGSSREVVSRLLKKLEVSGKLGLGRNQVNLH